MSHPGQLHRRETLSTVHASRRAQGVDRVAAIDRDVTSNSSWPIQNALFRPCNIHRYLVF